MGVRMQMNQIGMTEQQLLVGRPRVVQQHLIQSPIMKMIMKMVTLLMMKFYSLGQNGIQQAMKMTFIRLGKTKKVMLLSIHGILLLMEMRSQTLNSLQMEFIHTTTLTINTVGLGKVLIINENSKSTSEFQKTY